LGGGGGGGGAPGAISGFLWCLSKKRGDSGQNSRPVRIKFSTRSVLRLHHEVPKLTAKRVNIKVCVSLGGYTLLNVAAFFTKLANLAQEHMNLGGKSLARFI